MDGSSSSGHTLRSEATIQFQGLQGAALLAHMRQGLVWQAADGAVLDLNAAAASLLGLPAAEIIGAPAERLAALLCDDGLISLAVPRLPAMVALATGQAFTGYVSVRADDRWRRLQVDAFPDVVLGVPGAVSILSDVTDLAETRERLEVYDHWLGIVSHDLRSPLSTAIESLGLMREGIPPSVNGSLREHLELAERALHRSLRLVEDLLDMRRLEIGRTIIRPAAFSLDVFLADVIREHRPKAKRFGTSLHLRLAPNARRVIVADEDRLHQVFDNLISNALKNTSAAGVVRVSAVAMPAEVIITITDSGTGMTDAQIAKMFEWGWQADAKDSRGFGIGLAVVDMIVRGHGGRLWAERRPATGLSIHVAIPWTQPPAVV